MYGQCVFFCFVWVGRERNAWSREREALYGAVHGVLGAELRGAVRGVGRYAQCRVAACTTQECASLPRVPHTTAEGEHEGGAKENTAKPL